MRKILSAAAACLLIATPADADAPAFLPVQGVLANTDGTPVDGDLAVRFGLYTADIGGSELWNETQTVTVSQGFFTVYLGDTNVLDLGLFRDNGTLWLGVRVGTDPEMNRFQVAGDAASLGGTPAGDFLTTSSTIAWSDLSGVPPDLADGDNDTTYSAGIGLTLTGTSFAADQGVIEAWARGVSYDTAAELRAELDPVYAAASHAHDWSTIVGVPAGFADGVDNDTTYTPGTGLSLTGTSFALDTAYADGRYLNSGTSYISIAAIDCEPEGAAPGPSTCSGGGTLRTNGTTVFPCTVTGQAATLNTYTCRLDLPSGALIEEILAYGYDFNATGYLEAATWAMGDTTFSPTYYSDFLGTWQSSGLAFSAGNASFPIFTFGTPPHAVVAGSHYVIGFATFGSNVMVYGFRVRYTMP
jgi:hypothetical protein